MPRFLYLPCMRLRRVLLFPRSGFLRLKYLRGVKALVPAKQALAYRPVLQGSHRFLARNPSRLSSCICFAVGIKIGKSYPASRSCLVSSMPFMRGIMISLINRSTWLLSNPSNACSPLNAARGSYPAFCKTAQISLLAFCHLRQPECMPWGLLSMDFRNKTMVPVNPININER